jgi:hypothetical protein
MSQRFLLLTTVLQLEPPIFKSLRMLILSNGTVGDKGKYLSTLSFLVREYDTIYFVHAVA